MDNYSGAVNLSGGGGGGERRMPGMGVLMAEQGQSATSSLGKQACRVDVEEMDERRGGGPMKVARTDAVGCSDLKMYMGEHQQHLVRSSESGSGCLMSEGRLGMSDGMVLIHDGSGTVVSEGGRLLSAGAVPAARPGLPFQVYQYKPAAGAMPMPLSVSSVGMVRPPFTPSQWQELEHQAMIFKYMMAGLQVPSDLLLPIRKSFFSYPPGSHHQPGMTPWSSFQIGGYGGNVDPEPGRCRRTDGKKWRCSRDVVPDQKYCERHMHRGRHRGSRKPVEGHTAAANTLTSQTHSTASNTTSTSTSGAGGGTSALSLAAVNTSSKLHPPLSIDTQLQTNQHSTVARYLSCGGNNATQFHQYPLHVSSATAKDCRYLNGMKGGEMDEQFGLRTLAGQEFGLMTEGSQATGFHKNPRQEQHHSFLGSSVREQQGQPLRHFFDEWPRSRDPWAAHVEEDDERSSHGGGPSSTPSPRGKLSLSSLKLSMSREEDSEDPLNVDPAKMGLAVGMNMKINVENRQHPHNNWAWENPMGMLGPLAEVLQSSTSTPRGNNNNNRPPGLNLMNNIGWNTKEMETNNSNRSASSHNSSPSCIASSPKGVLQKTFGSISETTNSAGTSSSQIASS